MKVWLIGIMSDSRSLQKEREQIEREKSQLMAAASTSYPIPHLKQPQLVSYPLPVPAKKRYSVSYCQRCALIESLVQGIKLKYGSWERG